MKKELPPYSEAAKHLAPGAYKHYKGGTYRVLDIGRNESDLEEVVIYQALHGEYDIFVRPLESFLEKVEYEGAFVPRFTLILEEK